MAGLVWLGIILVALWLVLWIGFHVVSVLIHILLVVGVVLLIWGLIKRGAHAVSNGS
jgi:hypothetical protein